MNIIAQVCWYDEPPAALRALIDSLAGFVDAAVFLDGAYSNFPHVSPVSPSEQYVEIIQTCRDHNILPIVPPGRLYDTQADKRSHMFMIAEAVSSPFVDYTLIIDADEILSGFDHRAVRDQLYRHKPDAVLVALNTPAPNKPRTQYQRQKGIHMPFNSTHVHGRGVPRIFRMLEDVSVGPKYHGSYVGRREDGELICLKDRGREFEYLPAKASVLDLSAAVEITNATWQRDPARIAAKHVYGKKRSRLREDL